MTHREIVQAYNAKVDFEKSQTAELLAMIANIRPRGENDRKMYRGSDFYVATTEKNKPRAGSGNMSVSALRALGKQLFGVGQ